ncbi:WD40-repeat-containing domain protein [Lentinula raphanica]|nr:WD40-repeat-containing domain protein [Lentinula raphanica]
MVKDLPGFYFDTERNRYFPLSSRPSSSTSATRSSTQRNGPERKRFRIETEANEPTVPRTIFHWTRTLPYSTTQRLFDCSLSSATRCNSLITHQSATTEDGLTRRYIGDDRGWFYTGVVAQTYMWPPDINLHSQSEVSSIKVSGQTCVTTCFGPITKVAVQDLRVSGRTTLLTFNKVHDVRGSHFQDGSLILGAKNKAVYIPDINESGYIQYLYNSQNSDIFALDRDENIVYTGARNGSITRHDLRVPSEKHGHWLFQSRFSAQNNSRQPRQASSVSYLKLVKQSELIVSQMNGELCTYDTRFPLQNRPSRQFRGHRNSVTSRLGICVDPAHDFLFAAGEDYCIRGWSLRTGQALHAYDGTSASTAPVSTAMLNSSSTSSSLNWFRNPFKALFPKAVSTLQITEESDGSLCLWAGCQQTLYRYFLGQYSKEP